MGYISHYHSGSRLGVEKPTLFTSPFDLSLPLEISRTWFPHLFVLDKLGKFVGVIYFGRILTLAVIAYFIYNLLRSRRTNQFLKNARDDLAETFSSPLFIALGSYARVGKGLRSSSSGVFSSQRGLVLPAICRIRLGVGR